MNNRYLDSYQNSIDNIVGDEFSIIPYGGVKMVAQCYSNRVGGTIFPGVFYKDAVLSIMSRANSNCVYVYNKYSFYKAKEIFEIFNIDVIVKSEPYLVRKYSSESLETGLSVFFEQSVVPYLEVERLYVIKKLISFATLNIDRRVVICTRDYKNSPHTPKVTFQDIVEKYQLVFPRNLEIIVGSARDWLPKAEHVISITSSVILDGVYNKKSVSVLAIPRSAHYGQGLFANSGLMCNEIGFPTQNVDEDWESLHVEPFFEEEHLKSLIPNCFKFNLDFSNFSKILKANYLHFGKVDWDFVKYSVKNTLFFRKYRRIYLQHQRNKML
ncbi:DUF6716 putative glycosyltransferase [Enterovibrio norvegicus]|uniref:DUF6716 putative glycosyltransferase n=1 Tax=Enterovibrio norvegicus TaxID=188144 RepID=UPI0035544563